ncbi:MAG: hypothetical protein HZA22_04785 [Nitrospirae bacterium]|nr:hypothetical protein [Nitrospirota bacterium]
MLITILIALIVFLLDVTGFRYYGAGFLGVIALVKFALTVKDNKVLATKRLAVYMLTVVFILTINTYNARIAESRGNVLIACLEQYKLDHGTYPEQLEDLVPEYTDQIPSPYYPDMGKFAYRNFEDGRVSFYYAITFGYTNDYFFEWHEWVTRDH